MPPNPYLLAADNSPALLPLLRADPSIARQQDEHGYSLIHAAASYNHLDLLRILVNELEVPVDLRDEDSETALYVVETVEAARCLVEELKLDPNIRGVEGTTAKENIEAEGDFPLVVEYLKNLESGTANGVVGNGGGEAVATEVPPVPEGLSVTMGNMAVMEDAAAADPEIRRRIEEFAAREDFHTPLGQAELRRLVQDAIASQGLTEERNVRPRQN